MLKRRNFSIIAACTFLVFGSVTSSVAQDDFIVVQSTTSTQNSGLFDHLLPQFQKETGIEVRVVAVGTGQAIKNAANGDGDVLFVHSKPSEEKFVADGNGIERFDVMFNDFVIVGPSDDPAQVAGMRDVVAALSAIAKNEAPFASRGDDSGTHKAERRLWAETQVDLEAASGDWYRETGSGMGATLNTSVAMNAYAMTDRATWISFGNKGDLKIVVQGDEKMFNQYGIILVNNAKHKNVKSELGQSFVDWVTSAVGQAAIADFQVGGQQLFFPNAKN